MSYLCNVFGEMINTLRGIPSDVKLGLYVACAILMFMFLIKAIKTCFYPKDEKKRNVLWFLPIILLAIFVYMLSI